MFATRPVRDWVGDSGRDYGVGVAVYLSANWILPEQAQWTCDGYQQ